MAIVERSPTSLVFTVRRSEPELVSPAKSTPHEFKQLSDLDDRRALRHQVPFIQVYRYDESAVRRDPAKVIRGALARTLVFYYPFAGRLRQGTDQKLILECTGEGVMFIEADADVKLDQFGDEIHPPFPCLDQLLYDVPGSGDILNCPLLLIQVTRLRCGGFIFAIRLNHIISDAVGIAQFITAVGEIARGAHAPSIPPVWQRELLNARNPPRVTCTHREFDQAIVHTNSTTLHVGHDLSRSFFFFGSTEVSAIRKALPQHLRKSSTFEILAACLWRCRTIALQLNPEEEVRLVFTVDMRRKFRPPLPKGYYGNAVALPVAVTTAANLCRKPLEYALELVRTVKNSVNDEYVRSFVDLLVLKGKPRTTMSPWSYFMSDASFVGFRDVDFGWGKAAYGGTAKVSEGPHMNSLNYHLRVRNSKGEDGTLVPICLPPLAVERFVKELYSFLNDQSDSGPMPTNLKSSL